MQRDQTILYVKCGYRSFQPMQFDHCDYDLNDHKCAGSCLLIREKVSYKVW